MSRHKFFKNHPISALFYSIRLVEFILSLFLLHSLQTRIILLILGFSLVSSISVNAVPVTPNKSVLKGRVKEYCLISSSRLGIAPDQVLYKLVISIEETQDVEGYENFLRDREGESVTFYAKTKPPFEVYGKRIRALVEYKGDERGGVFWIKHIEILK